MMTDPIADMLVRINNACAMRHETVEVPSSKTKTSISFWLCAVAKGV